MIINRYNWEEEGAPILPHLDAVLQKFERVIVATNEEGKVIGYSGYNEMENRHLITSFWTSKKNEVVQKALLDELKKELNFYKQKRIGMSIETEDDKFIKLLENNKWYVHLANAELDIYEPSRACYQLSIPPAEMEELRKLDEQKI